MKSKRCDLHRVLMVNRNGKWICEKCEATPFNGHDYIRSKDMKKIKKVCNKCNKEIRPDDNEAICLLGEWTCSLCHLGKISKFYKSKNCPNCGTEMQLGSPRQRPIRYPTGLMEYYCPECYPLLDDLTLDEMIKKYNELKEQEESIKKEKDELHKKIKEQLKDFVGEEVCSHGNYMYIDYTIDSSNYSDRLCKDCGAIIRHF